MFRGQFVHSVDVKGRVSLPARFRDLLVADGDARFVLTPALFDPCLHLYPMRAWEELERKLLELPTLERHAMRFRRMYVSAAVECELDGSGRVLVPPQLRERALLEKEVVWAGMGRILELWAKTAWDRALGMSDGEQAEFRQAMEQLKI
ncbi:MAG TPA: division/cell wall cluster transcriptional repressor MraZ [Polyangiaceae bacterium]|jgi:MraZ protein|nr:division/cell wall cluster transcriptional repressor MraZ [Polyangiaceae bacterium]